MTTYEWIGWCAAGLSSVSLLPQIIKGLRTRSLRDLSVIMLVVMATAAICWLLYGMYREDPVIIATNLCAICFLLALFILKFAYRPARRGGGTSAGLPPSSAPEP